jgi:hypothetical protein
MLRGVRGCRAASGTSPTPRRGAQHPPRALHRVGELPEDVKTFLIGEAFTIGLHDAAEFLKDRVADRVDRRPAVVDVRAGEDLKRVDALDPREIRLQPGDRRGGLQSAIDSRNSSISASPSSPGRTMWRATNAIGSSSACARSSCFQPPPSSPFSNTSDTESNDASDRSSRSNGGGSALDGERSRR